MKSLIFSVMNHKGGVGKTTTAVSLAAGWAEKGQRVLLIDNDPQGSAGLSLGVSNDGEVLLQALSASSALPVIETVMPELYLVPSGPGLVEARRRFSGEIGIAFSKQGGPPGAGECFLYRSAGFRKANFSICPRLQRGRGLPRSDSLVGRPVG